MKQLLKRTLALLLAVLTMATAVSAANKSGYSDVPDKHWAASSIAQCKQYDLLQGVGNGKFGLGQKMTRAAYASALCRLMGWKTVTPQKGSFSDNQDTKKWYYSAVETAAAHDVFPGHSTTCRPNDAVTREEMAAMTMRALGYSTLSGTVQEIEASASAASGETYSLPFSLSTRSMRAPLCEFLDENALRTALTEQSGELDTLAVISIDGTRAGVCHNAEEAQTLLDRVKRLYTTQADSSADFVQQVHVDSVVAESRLAGEPQTVFETLSDHLDVRARRSVTYTETIPFGTVTRENDAEYQDYRETVRQGQTGEAVVTAEIQTLDGEENERTIVARTVLRSASDEIVEVGTKNIGIGTGSFVRPVSGYTFTSAFKWRWGRLHSGVDLAVPEGTPVRASDNGKVILAENSGDGYGNYIILDHGNGFKTLYGHNSALCVSVGDIVSQGDLIAYSGNTGNSTGPHLHFEIHLDDEKVDPERFLSF